MSFPKSFFSVSLSANGSSVKQGPQIWHKVNKTNTKSAVKAQIQAQVQKHDIHKSKVQVQNQLTKSKIQIQGQETKAQIINSQSQSTFMAENQMDRFLQHCFAPCAGLSSCQLVQFITLV
uniref:Uncharacterized protein n=1 Tax=Micrurus lemniscatus lemniscatus TaxID=129467 RepID=A0A2D4IEG8_MICLE